jgi:hypothetical protein
MHFVEIFTDWHINIISFGYIIMLISSQVQSPKDVFNASLLWTCVKKQWSM